MVPPEPTRANVFGHPLLRCGVELILTTAPVCFLVFATLVIKNACKLVHRNPVPALQEAAKYGPTLFPIAFAAAIRNMLSAATAFKLEKGIAEDSVEYLLRS